MQKVLGRWSARLATLRRPGPARPVTRSALLLDGGLALLIAVLIAASAEVHGGLVDSTAALASSRRAWAIGIGLAVALPLVFRRRVPLTTFWLVLLVVHASRHALGVGPTFLVVATVIAAYSAAMHSPYQMPAISSVLLGTVVLLVDYRSSLTSVRPGILMVCFLVPVVLAAATIHTWRRQIRALERQQQLATRRAVEQERSRIARDLHDVVSHNVSVIVIQAGAARRVMDSRPDLAREALLAVEDGGRAAMTELRHVMGLLTADSADVRAAAPDAGAEQATLAPQPGIDQVADLVDRVRDTGARVRLQVTGSVAPLPPGVGLAAYRVVQEALTNTLKHAPGSEVAVLVDYRPGTIRLRITNSAGKAEDTRRTRTHDTGGGHGLVGLRERIGIYGGTVQTEHLPDGGYRLEARIPTDAG
ncbi:sensor histidine kinase [Actinocatenispora thailandica]|uniref:sensor histidine kinase n=1 Tax=Actinocatenispora thailandica TaxID=227318 RepID=UPI00194E4E7B|nr:histidine kinase [Actinocatenispora thailandica]